VVYEKFNENIRMIVRQEFSNQMSNI
jgi:hypothetical protein